jgi:hypothetical protein
MALREGIADVLIRISNMKPRAEKLAELRRNYSPAMEIIVQAAFAPTWVWLLPETPCPYSKTKTSKAHDFQGVFFSESRKLNIYRRGGGYDNVIPKKREVIYQEWLETMDPDDAVLIEHIRIEKKMPYKGLTEKLFQEAYPALFARFNNN